MNRNRARELLPIIQAFADGEEIEFQLSDRSWCSATTPTFNADHEFRIKLKPREFWIADVNDEFRKVLRMGQKDLSAGHQYIHVKEIL